MDSSSKDVALFKYYDTPDYQLSPQDLLVLYRRKGMVNKDVKEVVDYLSLNFNDLKNMLVLYDFDYQTVKILNISLKNVCSNFLVSLSDAGIQMERAFRLLALDKWQFLNAYLNDSEQELYTILATANYSQEFISEVAEIPIPDLFLSFLNDNNSTSLLERIELIVGKDVVSFMRNFGVSQQDLTKFLSVFIEDLQDLQHKPAYRDLLRGIEEVQRQKSFATWNSYSKKLITANSELLELYYIGLEYLLLTTVVNKTEILLVPENLLTLSNDLMLLDLSRFNVEFPEVNIINPFHVNDCYYYSNEKVINIPGMLVSSRVNSIGTYEIIQLINSTDFVLGSPIFCNNELMGVATKHYSNSVTIFAFYNSFDDVDNSISTENNKHFLVREKRDLILKTTFWLTRTWENILNIFKGFFTNSCRC